MPHKQAEQLHGGGAGRRKGNAEPPTPRCGDHKKLETDPAMPEIITIDFYISAVINMPPTHSSRLEMHLEEEQKDNGELPTS